MEKSWGPNYLKFGLGLASRRRSRRAPTSAPSHRATWLNSLGAEWRNSDSASTTASSSEFYQPFDDPQRGVRRAALQGDEKPIAFFVDGRPHRSNTWWRQTRVHVDVGVQNKFGELHFGGFVGRLRAKEDFGLTTVAPNYDIDQSGYTASATIDQIDRPQFPRNGILSPARGTTT